jgi:hypothetical protein
MIIFADLQTRRLLLLNMAIMNARIAGRHIRSSISFNCPFSGRMRFVYRHFPLTEMHPHAEIAAESAEWPARRDCSGICTMRCSKPEQAEHYHDLLIGAELGLPETYDYASLVSAIQTRAAADTNI